jgi:hypothetical protein
VDENRIECRETRREPDTEPHVSPTPFFLFLDGRLSRSAVMQMAFLAVLVQHGQLLRDSFVSRDGIYDVSFAT